MRKSSVLIVFLSMGWMSISSCSKKQASPQEYMNYINSKENGLLKSIDIGDYLIEVQYRPVEYTALQEIGVDQATKETLNELVQQHKGEHCVLFRIGSKDKKTDALAIGITDQQQYNDRISYLISQINKDIYLVDGKDTIPCSMHHFERSYHLTHYHTILFTFDKPEGRSKEEEGDKTIVYNDNLLGIGKMNIRIDEKDIQHIPTIQL
jgi:hypothetical protein